MLLQGTTPLQLALASERLGPAGGGSALAVPDPSRRGGLALSPNLDLLDTWIFTPSWGKKSASNKLRMTLSVSWLFFLKTKFAYFNIEDIYFDSTFHNDKLLKG